MTNGWPKWSAKMGWVFGHWDLIPHSGFDIQRRGHAISTAYLRSFCANVKTHVAIFQKKVLSLRLPPCREPSLGGKSPPPCVGDTFLHAKGPPCAAAPANEVLSMPNASACPRKALAKRPCLPPRLPYADKPSFDMILPLAPHINPVHPQKTVSESDLSAVYCG